MEVATKIPKKICPILSAGKQNWVWCQFEDCMLFDGQWNKCVIMNMTYIPS